jgi:hypothetical protein
MAQISHSHLVSVGRKLILYVDIHENKDKPRTNIMFLDIIHCRVLI